MFFLLWMINFLYAEPMTIVVEEHANIEVYVSTPKILNYSEDTEGTIGSKSVYSYNSMYWKDAKVINERGTYDKLGLKSVVKVYDKDTIDYAYSNCNYLIDAKKCANQNNHYLVETIITIDDHETVVQMMIFNPDMTLLNVATVSDRGEINYIKQQEIKMSMKASSIDITIMPEKKPLKWVIPVHLTDRYIQQASKGLWLGVKIQ